MNTRRGFTLTELLVVIFIIGLLSAVIFPRFGPMREKARDTERMTDVLQIQTYVEMHFNRTGSYPVSLNDISMPGGVPTGPQGDSYAYRRSGCAGAGSAPYSISFTAENVATFAEDSAAHVSGNTVCVQP